MNNVLRLLGRLVAIGSIIFALFVGQGAVESSDENASWPVLVAAAASAAMGGVLYLVGLDGHSKAILQHHPRA